MRSSSLLIETTTMKYLALYGTPPGQRKDEIKTKCDLTITRKHFLFPSSAKRVDHSGPIPRSWCGVLFLSSCSYDHAVSASEKACSDSKCPILLHVHTHVEDASFATEPGPLAMIDEGEAGVSSTFMALFDLFVELFGTDDLL